MRLLRPAVTFCGFPFATPEALSGGVAILGAPHGTPYRPGSANPCAAAPAAVRGALGDYDTQPGQFDFDSGAPLFQGLVAADCGDVSGDPADGPGNRAAIERAVASVLARGAVPLLLGGDDSVPIPFFAAFRDSGPLTVLQVDAHIDWRDEVGGERYGYSSPMRRASEMPWIRSMVQIGARGVGSARQGEYDDARAWGSRFFPARELHRDGLAPVLEALPPDRPVILSIDVDGLDPSVVPGVQAPAHGGLTFLQALDLILGAAGRCRIAGALFVEYAPDRDPGGLGAVAVARLARATVTAIAGQQRG